MVNSWHKTRRSVEKDYKFYDPPRVVYRKITGASWPYSENNQERLGLRDLAFMCLMYGSTCRSSELCRYYKRDKDGGLLFSKHSVDKSQFSIEDDLLKFREVIVLKRREAVRDENGDVVYVDGKQQYKVIEDLSKYPTRNEITLPLTGSFSIFTQPIIEYLDTLDPEQELFPFRYRRGWQIVNYCTSSGKILENGKREPGEMQHYLRDMGLKFYSRLLDRNLKDLQEFSGHARIQNLMVYLGEGNLEKKIKEVKF